MSRRLFYYIVVLFLFAKLANCYGQERLQVDYTKGLCTDRYRVTNITDNYLYVWIRPWENKTNDRPASDEKELFTYFNSCVGEYTISSMIYETGYFAWRQDEVFVLKSLSPGESFTFSCKKKSKLNLRDMIVAIPRWKVLSFLFSDEYGAKTGMDEKKIPEVLLFQDKQCSVPKQSLIPFEWKPSPRGIPFIE